MHKYLLILVGFAFCYSHAAAQCPVDFQFTPSGLDVTFYPTNPNVDSSYWSFGDGSTQTSDQPAVTHTYSEPGTYTVCLGTAGVGCTDTICHTIIICGFTAAYSATTSGSVVGLTNLSTGNFGLVIWDFGDGFTSFDSTTNGAYHSYGAPGTYTVCLSVATSDNQCLTPYCEDITILGGGNCVDSSLIDLSFDCPDNNEPVCGCNGWSYDSPCDAYHHGVTSWSIGACTNCQASFTTSSNGLVVTFINNSLGDGVSYTWNFGDGASSTDSMPVHTYNASGTYTACLRIANGNICNDSTCQTFAVGNGNTCEAKYTLAGSCDSAVFINASTGNYDVLAWNVNNVPTLNMDTIVLTDTGTYVVCLSIHGDSCNNTKCDTFKVHAPDAFRPGFAATFTQGPPPVTVQFTGIDTAGLASSYTWDFGDGGFANVQNPTHVFDSCGVNVCLTVTDVFGCSETYCDSLFVCDVSIRSVNASQGFGLYPNPGRNVCYLVAKQNATGDARLVITDLTGRVISERTINDIHQGKTISVNTSQYAQGCYFFNLVSQQHTASIRWIKE